MYTNEPQCECPGTFSLALRGSEGAGVLFDDQKNIELNGSFLCMGRISCQYHNKT